MFLHVSKNPLPIVQRRTSVIFAKHNFISPTYTKTTPNGQIPPSTVVLITDNNSQQPRHELVYLKSFKRNDNVGVSSLKSEGKLFSHTVDKAGLLNKQFQSAFSSSEEVTQEEFFTLYDMPTEENHFPVLEDQHHSKWNNKALKGPEPKQITWTRKFKECLKSWLKTSHPYS